MATTTPPPPLPIDTLLEPLITLLAKQPIVVLQAPPGSGKTTRVPPALLTAPWREGTILMLEPRRLAARSAAARIASELGEAVGERVGYQIRFERQISTATQIEVVTEGLLTRRLQQDPELTGVSVVIFDEFHERHLDSDLALALCRDAAAGLRPDLRLILMSATLDAERLGEALNAPLLVSECRAHPVTIHYRPPPPSQPLAQTVVATVREAITASSGDLLLFLPGYREIMQCQQQLMQAQLPLQLVILHGDLPLAAQQQAVTPQPGIRRLVLATNIAESSLTIEGIEVVIDSGLMRAPQFDPSSAMTRLQTLRISAASAEQRSGRAGRLGPGIGYRLWSEATQRGLLAHHRPELLQADLAPLALQLALWGISDAAQLAWLDAPPSAALAQAWQLLQQLGAVDETHRITALGRQIATFPLHPRLAAMLLQAQRRGWQATAIDLAALLSERDPFPDRHDPDIEPRLRALAAWRTRRAGGRPAATLPGEDMRWHAIDRVATQYRQLLATHTAAATAVTPADSATAIAILIATAYPERIAAATQPGDPRYRLRQGGAARWPAQAPQRPPALLAIAALQQSDRVGGGVEPRITLAAELTPDQLAQACGDAIRWEPQLHWDSTAARIEPRQAQRLGALLLATRAWPDADPDQINTALLTVVQRLGSSALPWRERSRQLQARLLSLRQWQPTAGWPDMSDANLLANLPTWLAPWSRGITRLAQLQQLDLTSILQQQLDWPQQQRLAELAPAALTVPSGRQRPLHYHADGSSPQLAVKLQELFGLAETPRVAAGTIPVTLQLLSPAGRPIQITQDLSNFWNHTYAQVRRELKGRYPKHPWPEAPWEAVPTAAPKRRR